MRRLTLILSLAVLMALAVSAAAFAANLSASGVLGYRMVYAQFEDSDDQFQLKAQRRIYGYLDFKGSRGPVSGFLRFRVRGNNPSGSATTDWVDMYNTNLGSLAGAEFFEAYADYKGAIIPGILEGDLRIGRFSTNQNNWVGNFSRREALMLSGVKLGPANLTLYHGWRSANDNQRVTAVKATGKVDFVNLTGMYVFLSQLDDPKNEQARADFVIEASATPIKDLKVDAAFASNGATKASNQDAVYAWKLNGELSTIPNLKLRASTWSTDKDFNTAYKHNTNREKLDMNREWFGRPTAYGDPWMETGFSIGATTTQAGLPIDVDFKSGTIFDAGANNSHVPAAYRGKSMTVISAGTTIAEIKTNLAVTSIADNDPVIDLVGTRRVNVSFLGGHVDLKGTLRLQDLADTPGASDDENKKPRIGADAIWTAPNGLVLGVHYANYDRKIDWGHNFSIENLSEGFDIGGKPDAGERRADGFAITAGYQLSF